MLKNEGARVRVEDASGRHEKRICHDQCMPVTAVELDDIAIEKLDALAEKERAVSGTQDVDVVLSDKGRDTGIRVMSPARAPAVARRTQNENVQGDRGRTDYDGDSSMP